MEQKLYPVRALIPHISYTDTISDPDIPVVYHWDKRGDILYMSLRAIQIMFANHPNYKDWVLPDDDEALVALGMTRGDYERIKARADKANRKRGWF